MTVLLFRAFQDAYRKSMAIYADQLAAGLRRQPGDHVVREVDLPNAHLRPALARYWDQYVRYQRLAGRSRADVYHIVDHGYGHLARSLPTRRTVVTFHDAVAVKTNRVRLSTRLSLRWSLAAIRKVACVVASSHVSRNDLLGLVDYPAERVKVVYVGIDSGFHPALDRDALRARLGFARPVILHVGHTRPYMNVTTVLRVLETIARRHHIDAELVKVGEAFTADQEALIDRLNLRPRVRHLGVVPLARLREIYCAADVLLYPPLYAGFGLPPLEAMACGTPVVCSSRGSLPEVAGDAALMADATDEAALAGAVVRLMTDATLAADHRSRGLARASRFTWDATVREMLEVYRDVAGA